MEDVDDKKMPLLDHLIELRQRLLYSVAGLIVVFLVCFYFADQLLSFLIQPLCDLRPDDPVGCKVIYTAMHEAFFTEVKVAFFAALFVSFPLIASQLWLFVAPGLYRNEKSAFLPFLVATPILFFLGGAFVYYFVMPVAWQFFAGYQKVGGAGEITIELLPKIGEYLALVMRLIFAFGISFELPVLLTLLARVGMATSTGLKQKRKYAIVLAFVAAAVLTPPDPLSQVGLALPIILLYEISIISARLIERKRVEDGIDDEDWDDDDDDDLDDDGAVAELPGDPGDDNNG
jgi:sec-independent protein translocase protein TatC